MRTMSAFLVATALTVAPLGLAQAAEANTSGKTVLGVGTGVDKEPKARSETTVTGRGKVDPTGTPTGANAAGPAATGGRDRPTTPAAMGRSNIDPTGRPTGRAATGGAEARGGAGIGRGNVDPTGKATGANMHSRRMGDTSMTSGHAMGKPAARLSRSRLNAYEEAKVAALNMPQSTQAERDARAAAMARADAMIQ